MPHGIYYHCDDARPKGVASSVQYIPKMYAITVL